MPIITLLQKTTEGSKRGRVMSFVNMGAMVAMPISYGITGFLLEQIGAIPLIIAIGSLTLIGSSACFRSREIMAAS